MRESMSLKRLIGEIIEMRENDLLISKHYFEDMGEEWNYEEVDHAFDRLQSVLTRVLIGHNYCSNPKCSCSAKSRTEDVFKKYDSLFKEHLYDNQYEFLLDKISASGRGSWNNCVEENVGWIKQTSILMNS